MYWNDVLLLFLCFHNNNLYGQYIILIKQGYMLRVPLLPRDIYNIKLRPLNIFTDFIDICDKQMLMYGYIKFWQLSVKECVNHKQRFRICNVLLTHTFPFCLKNSDLLHCLVTRGGTTAFINPLSKFTSLIFNPLSAYHTSPCYH